MKPRLVFITHSAKLSAGSCNSLLNLIHLLKLSYEILVMVPDEGDLVKALKNMNIRYQIFPLRRRTLLNFVKYLQKENPDIIYGNNFSLPVYFGFIATKFLRKPFVWHIREFLDSPSPKPLVWGRMIIALGYADGIIANSQSTLSSIKKFLPRKNITMIYNGIDNKDFSINIVEARLYVRNALIIPQKSLVITNVGRITPAKNQLESIKVFKILLDEFPFVELCLLGELRDPAYAALIKDTTNTLGIQNHVHMFGQCSEVPKFLCGSDILLHTSLTETHGRVMLEAMAAGIPSVVYDVGGISETVQNYKTGYLVPFGDTAKLISAVRKLINDSDLRNRMGDFGRKRVENCFSSEKTANQVDTVIKEILAKRRVIFP